jgi:dihydroorotase
MSTLTLTQPDDWHLHLRDGEVLATTVAHSAAQFARALIMPNLRPPVTTVAAALAYKNRIMQNIPKGHDFTPLMSLYLIDSLSPTEIIQAKESRAVVAAKLYPAGATTNAEAGVTAIEKIYPVLAAMEEQGLLLLVHGEVTDPEVDVFDREKVFIDRVLRPVIKRFPQLRIVFEHITTADAVNFVVSGPATLAATITVHHLLYARNALFQGGLRPHFYCLPVLKRSEHQAALIKAATSGSPKFFLGTDSAPHAQSAKESGCGCAGIYTAHAALPLYAEVFEAAGALDKLEAFASHFGADFYQLPRNTKQLTLTKQEWQVPPSYVFGEGRLVPCRADEMVAWRVGN